MKDSVTRFRITTGIRRAYFLWEARKEALKNCETAIPSYKKNGEPKLRLGKQCYKRTYECALCGERGFKLGKPKTKTKAAIPGFQIDHISAVGGAPGSKGVPKWWNWEFYVTRMFVEVEGFQGLCHPCHRDKTVKDKADMRSGKFYKEIAKVIDSPTDK